MVTAAAAMPSDSVPTSVDGPVASVKQVSHHYGKVKALDSIDLDIPPGLMVGVVGPDGVGKSTLLALLAGSKKLQQGSVTVLGGDIADVRHRRTVCPQIAYMPQGLGKNLYLELSVYDNVDFMAQLFGLSPAERKAKVNQLLEATGLAPFPDRPAGKLSGGMKQKVGLCGALVHDPDLLVLDEPTTGVDPLSRRQFWSLIDEIRKDRPSMSVVIATAYMDEAQQWDWIVAMDAGKVLATGTPAELMEKTGTKDLEACFIALLPEEKRAGHTQLAVPPRPEGKQEIVIDAKGLTKRFGSFTAVDHVSLQIERGEIFGFLGSNGCGKSTTMKMLTGLLPPTEGSATLFGQSVEAGSMEVRKNLGYMTQAFSLYGELTVRENLILDARLYHIPPDKAKARIDELVQRFGLGPHIDAQTDSLPMGLKQRLSLAVAVLHEPQILILDEPTSGVDPVARDSFWELLVDLSRNQGVTIFITTHFMNEGLRCDRISLMNSGKVLACDAPQKLIESRKAANLEDAFIAYMEEGIAAAAAEAAKAKAAAPAAPAAAPAEKEPAAKEKPAAPGPVADPQAKGTLIPLPLRRMWAYARNETAQIQRDPVRLTFAFVGSALLMLLFGFGITSDVKNIRYTVFDRDQTALSREYLEQFRGSPEYFATTQAALTDQEGLERLQADDVTAIIEIPPSYGRDLRRDSPPEILAQVDGANPFRGETVAQYIRGVHQGYLSDPGSGLGGGPPAAPGASIQARFMYNPTVESIYSIVPSVPALLLSLIPAIL